MAVEPSQNKDCEIDAVSSGFHHRGAKVISPTGDDDALKSFNPVAHAEKRVKGFHNSDELAKIGDIEEEEMMQQDVEDS